MPQDATHRSTTSRTGRRQTETQTKSSKYTDFTKSIAPRLPSPAGRRNSEARRQNKGLAACQAGKFVHRAKNARKPTGRGAGGTPKGGGGGRPAAGTTRRVGKNCRRQGGLPGAAAETRRKGKKKTAGAALGKAPRRPTSAWSGRTGSKERRGGYLIMLPSCWLTRTALS